VRIKLNDGPDLLVKATLAEVTAALNAATQANEPIVVNLPSGTFELNPGQVVSLAEEQQGLVENGQERRVREPEPA